MWLNVVIYCIVFILCLGQIKNILLLHAVEVVDGMPRAGSIKFRNVSRAGQNRVAGRTWPAGRVLHVVGLGLLAYIFAARKNSQQYIFAGRYFRGKLFSREDIFAGRYFREKIGYC